jgi:hypothetical protein
VLTRMPALLARHVYIMYPTISISFNSRRAMAHLERAEGYELEISSDDGLDIISTTRKSVGNIGIHIKSKILR